MYAIEFQTRISNGSIELPPEFRDKLAGEVRVIVLKQESPAEVENMIDRLLAEPIKLDSFEPMTRDEMHERS